jgi:hypothetical protein
MSKVALPEMSPPLAAEVSASLRRMRQLLPHQRASQLQPTRQVEKTHKNQRGSEVYMDRRCDSVLIPSMPTPKADDPLAHIREWECLGTTDDMILRGEERVRTRFQHWVARLAMRMLRLSGSRDWAAGLRLFVSASAKPLGKNESGLWYRVPD